MKLPPYHIRRCIPSLMMAYLIAVSIGSATWACWFSDFSDREAMRSILMPVRVFIILVLPVVAYLLFFFTLEKKQ